MKNIIEKKIVMFIGTLQQGGAERVISILSRYMLDAGYKVEILLYHDLKIFYEIHPLINIRFVERESKTRNIFKNLLWIRQYFKNSADIVVSFLAPFNILALIAHMGLKLKIVVADRNDPRYIPENKIIRFIRDTLYYFADGVVLQTSQNKDYFDIRIQKKSTIILNPIDLGEKAGLASRSSKQKKIVSVGRLMPQKNQKMLLDAFVDVSRNFPEHELFIYGEGPERENLEKYAQELLIQNKLHLPGSVKDVFEQIADAELFVLCSNYEGMPNALMEAMCLGLPCISTRVSGVDNLIQEGHSGEIIEPGDIAALSEKMQELLSSLELREKYAKNALILNCKLATDEIMNKWFAYLGEL